jgi:hypothetical protein
VWLAVPVDDGVGQQLHVALQHGVVELAADVLSYDPNSVSQEKGRLLTERSGGPFHWRSIHSLLVSRRHWHCNWTPDIVNSCWLAPVVFPSRVEGVFHVKSRVSCGLIPLLVVVYSPSFITSGTRAGFRFVFFDVVDDEV